MINTKNKRKLEYMAEIYYWYVKLHDKRAKAHIISEDKKIRLCCTSMDSEVPITPQDVADCIEKYLRQTH